MTNTVHCDGKLGLRIHATSFVLTLAALIAVNHFTGGHPWVLWVGLSWGIGLVAHWWFGTDKTATA